MRRCCFISEPNKRPGKPWTSRKILSVSALQAGRVSDVSAASPAFICCLNMRERVVFVSLSCPVIPAQTRVLFERGLWTPCLTVPWHCLSCQTTRGSKHTASRGELAERSLCINMHAAAQLAAMDANESWSSYSQLQPFRSVSSIMKGTNYSAAQTLMRRETKNRTASLETTKSQSRG